MEVEDGHMLELAVKLPAALPLRPPELECRRKVGTGQLCCHGTEGSHPCR